MAGENIDNDSLRELGETQRQTVDALAGLSRQFTILNATLLKSMGVEQKRQLSYQEATEQIEDFGDAAESTDPFIRAFNKNLDKAAQRLENYSYALDHTTKSLTDGFKKLVDTNDRSFGKFNGAIEGVTDGLAKISGPLAPFVRAVGTVVTAMAEHHDALLKGTDSLAQMGANIGITTSQLREMAHGAGVTSKNLEILVKPIKSLSVDIRSLATNAGDGAKEFAKLTHISSEQRQYFQRLGVSQEQLIQNQADYIKLQSIHGVNIRGEIKDREKLKKETLEYTESLLVLASMTGNDVETVKKRQQEAANDLQWQISLFKKRREIDAARARGDDTEVKRLEKQAEAQAKALNTVAGLGNEFVTKGIRQMIATGTLAGEESVVLARMGLDKDVAELGKIIREGGDAQAAAVKFQDKYNAAFAKTVDAVGTSAQFSPDAAKAYGITVDTLKQASQKLGDVAASATDITGAMKKAATTVEGIFNDLREKLKTQGQKGVDPTQDFRATLTEAGISAGKMLDNLTSSAGMAAIAVGALGLAAAGQTFLMKNLGDKIKDLTDRRLSRRGLPPMPGGGIPSMPLPPSSMPVGPTSPLPTGYSRSPGGILIPESVVARGAAATGAAATGAAATGAAATGAAATGAAATGAAAAGAAKAASFATKAAGTGLRLLGKLAVPLAIATTTYDAFKGFTADKNTSTLDKFKNAGSSALSGLTFGLLGSSPEEIAERAAKRDAEKDKGKDKEKDKDLVNVSIKDPIPLPVKIVEGLDRLPTLTSQSVTKTELPKKAKDGGEFDGPKEGYLVELHGKETVVPENKKEQFTAQNLAAATKKLADAPKEFLKTKVTGQTGSTMAAEVSGRIMESVLEKFPAYVALKKLTHGTSVAGNIEKSLTSDNEGLDKLKDLLKAIPVIGPYVEKAENIQKILTDNTNAIEKAWEVVKLFHPGARMLGTLFNVAKPFIEKLNLDQQTQTASATDASEMPKAATGGIFEGPDSGYPVMLHGKEQITPLGEGKKVDSLSQNKGLDDKQIKILETFGSSIASTGKKLSEMSDVTSEGVEKYSTSLEKLSLISDKNLNKFDTSLDLSQKSLLDLNKLFNNLKDNFDDAPDTEKILSGDKIQDSAYAQKLVKVIQARYQKEFAKTISTMTTNLVDSSRAPVMSGSGVPVMSGGGETAVSGGSGETAVSGGGQGGYIPLGERSAAAAPPSSGASASQPDSNISSRTTVVSPTPANIGISAPIKPSSSGISLPAGEIESEKRPALNFPSDKKTPAGGTPKELTGMAKKLAEEMSKHGITNPMAKKAIVMTAAKESGLNPKSKESGAGPYLNTLASKGLDYIYLVFPQLKPGGRVAKQLGFEETGVPADYLKAEWAKGDEAFFDMVYGGLGTNKNPGDGFKYRGRGFIQLTGRTVYDNAGKQVGEDFISDPEKVANDFEGASAALAGYLFMARGGKQKALAQMNNFKSDDEALKYVLHSVAGLGQKTTWDDKKSHLGHQLEKASQFASLGDTAIQAAEGGITSGPKSGYPATLHGNEIIVPLDPNSILADLGKKSSSEVQTQLEQKSVKLDTSDLSLLQNVTSTNQEMMQLLSSKLNDMIDKLDISNGVQEKLLKQMSI